MVYSGPYRSNPLCNATSPTESRACNARLCWSTDSVVGAWAHLGGSGELTEAAAAADQMRGAGLAGGNLHQLFGIPFGAKDIIQSRDFPTEYGSEIFRDNAELNQPASDASCIARLKSVGAILIVRVTPTYTSRRHLHVLLPLYF